MQNPAAQNVACHILRFQRRLLLARSSVQCRLSSKSNYAAAPGFGGHYTNKAGRTREGCATFFRCTRLRLVQRADVALKELFAPLLAPPAAGGPPAGRGERHARFAPMLRESPALPAALQKVRSWQHMHRISMCKSHRQQQDKLILIFDP